MEGGFESVTLDWSDTLRAELQAMLTRNRDPALLAQLGGILRQVLSPTDWELREAELLAAAESGRQVLLTIRSAAAELFALPWELLTLKATGQHIGELEQVLLRYEWPGTHTANQAAPTNVQGRILVAWSAAGGTVPAADHIAAVRTACAAGHYPFDQDRDVLENASVSGLAEALLLRQQEGRPIAVLHLLCHGGMAGSTFGLCLDGDVPGADGLVVDGGRLRQVLAPYAKTLRLVVLSACDSGNSGAFENQLGSVAQVLHRIGIAAVVASRYPLSVGSSVSFADAFYGRLLAEPASLETAFRAARRVLAHDATTLDWASLQLYARAADGDDSRPLTLRPFRGLLAFSAQESRFFFGRERETKEILTDLMALKESGKPRFLVVAGASGSGKSSAVLAGAVPGFEKHAVAASVCCLRPGGDPLAALDTALSAAAGKDAPLRLVVVDQFEEIYTHVKDATTRQSFVNRLWALACEKTPEIYVLLTLRVDFLGHCGELLIDGTGGRLDRVLYEEAHRVFIAQPGSNEMRAAIEEPLRRVGLRLEEGLLSRILSDVGAEPGALPILEDTLDILWQRRAGRELTQTAYDELEGVTGALKVRADALIAGCDDAERRMARRLMVRLVNMKLGQDVALSTRRRMPIAKLRPDARTDAERFDAVLAKMVEARLLVTSEEGGVRQVEVAHEALIRRWPQLHDWLRSDAGRLTAIEEFDYWSKQWREHGALLVGEQLAYAEALAKRSEIELGRDEKMLLAESRKFVRSQRRIGRLWVGAALFTLITVLLSIVFVSALYFSTGMWWFIEVVILALGTLASLTMLLYLGVTSVLRAISYLMGGLRRRQTQ